MRATVVILTLTLAGLSLTACGGDDNAPATVAERRAALSQDAPDPRVSGSTDTWPLTGLPAADGAATTRPVLVLKMDNTSSSAPQIGLSEADLVVEELVEGGVTRLAAFYYSDIPGDVGPVRSMRASDIGIVSPVGATMVTSGAAATTIARLGSAGVDYVSEGSAGFYRESSRSAPYNLMTNLKDVAKAAKQPAGRPADYLPFGAGALPAGSPAGSLDAVFSGGHTTSWTYRDSADGGGYVNENSYAADGDEFPADTVLVLRVQVGDAGYRDPAGNPVPETKLEGKGAAMLFHAGRLVRATWHKDALDAPLELTTAAGDLAVPAGRTWIELVPADGGGVTVRK